MANNDSYTSLMLRSRTLYQQGHYTDARKSCQSIYITDPANIDNLILLASIHFQLRNLTEAIFYSQQCLRCDSSCAEAYGIIGNSYKEQGDNLEDAANFLKKSIRFHPRFADAYNNLACLQFQQGSHLDAIDSLNLAVSLDPLLFDAFSNIGTIYKILGRFNEAKDNLLEAIRINPQCAIAWSNLGGLFSDAREYRKSVSCYKQAITIVPEFIDAHSNMGNALFHLAKENNYDSDFMIEAKYAYLQAKEIRSDFVINCANLALFEFHEGNGNESIKHFHQALQMDTNFSDALSNLAGIYFKKEIYDLCIRLSLRALNCKPDNWRAFNNVGAALLMKKCFSSAAALAFKYSNKIKDESISSIIGLGVAMMQQHQYGSAITVFQSALQADPHDQLILFNMGYAYASMNDFIRAKECYKFDTNDPTLDAKVHLNLAIIAQREGDLKTSISYLDKALLIEGTHRNDATNLKAALKILTADWDDLGKETAHQVMSSNFQSEYKNADTEVDYKDPEDIKMRFSSKILAEERHTLNCHFRSKYGISDDVFIYACFSVPYKITHDLYKVWMNVLKTKSLQSEGETSILILVRYNPNMERNLKREAEKSGVNPDRIIFLDILEREEHMKRYSMVDMYLDTVWSSSAAVFESISCKVPVVCFGENFIERKLYVNDTNSQQETKTSLNIMNVVGLGSLIVNSLEAYESLAILLQFDENKFIDILRSLDTIEDNNKD